MAKTTSSTRKTPKAGKKATQAKAVQNTTTKKVVTKKKSTAKPAQPAYLPLKGTSYVFVDFKDEALAAEITALGGTVNRSLKTAHVLVCEDRWGDKSLDAMNKYDRHDDAQTKEDVLDHIAELGEMGSKPIPTLQVGKKSIIVLSEWFTKKGVPLSSPDDCGESVVVLEDEMSPYDCCFHDDGNVTDMYTRLSRLQLLHDSSSSKYRVNQKCAFLSDLVTGSNSATSFGGQFDELDEAVKSFQAHFKDAVGYTWQNRAWCKPKKGSALLVDMDTF